MGARRKDWEARLGAYLDKVRARPFRYGQHDCCLFAGNAVRAMTGRDPVKEFRGKYRSAATAQRALREIGGGDLAHVMTAKFGTPIAPALAQRGDLVMSDGSLGVCMGGFAYFVGEEGGAAGLIRVARAPWVAPLSWTV